MKRAYSILAIMILAGMMTACGQQEREVLRLEPIQIQAVEDAEQSREDAESGREDAEPGSTESDQIPPDEDNAYVEEAEETQDAEDDGIASLYGTWQVLDYKPSQVYALSQQEIEEFLECRVSYYKDRFVRDGQSAGSENFGYTFLDGYLFQGYAWEDIKRDFQADLTEWWNGNSMVPMGWITSETGFFGDTFFLADEEQMWIYYEGVFFRAEKVGE